MSKLDELADAAARPLRRPAPNAPPPATPRRLPPMVHSPTMKLPPLAWVLLWISAVSGALYIYQQIRLAIVYEDARDRIEKMQEIWSTRDGHVLNRP